MDTTERNFTRWMSKNWGESFVKGFYAVFFPIFPEELVGDPDKEIKRAYTSYTPLFKKRVQLNSHAPPDIIEKVTYDIGIEYLVVAVPWVPASYFLTRCGLAEIKSHAFSKVNIVFNKLNLPENIKTSRKDAIEFFGFNPQYLPEWHPYKKGLLRQSKPFMDKEAVFGQL